MPEVLIFAANVLNSDSQGDPHADDAQRPDYALILFHEVILPLLRRELPQLGATLHVVCEDRLAWPTVDQVVRAHPEAVIVLFGHGDKYSVPPVIRSRRKAPADILAGRELIGRACRWQHLIACHSARLLCGMPANSRKPIICFTDEGLVPVPQNLARDLPGNAGYQRLVMDGYIQARARPVILAVQMDNPQEAIRRARNELGKTITWLTRLGEVTRNRNFQKYAAMLLDVQDRMHCK